ncbi:MAG: TolC family protein, partial [Pseudomonadota bacterium]
PAIPGEDDPLETLSARALAARPDVAAQRASVEAARADLAAERGALAPELSADAAIAATAVQPQRAALNWEGGLGLSVPIWGGGAARATVEAASEAADAARERLRLAEGRYEHGLGDSVELSDAQLDATRAQLRAVQARFDLASARAALLAALGEG